MTLLQEGDVIELTAEHTVYADVPSHFVYSNKRGDFSLTRHDVRIIGEFSYLAGKYIVVKTTHDGGGTGMGPHDVYPDGHHVFCERAADGVKVDFYQTGSFTAMNENIKPVGKAVRTWKEA